MQLVVKVFFEVFQSLRINSRTTMTLCLHLSFSFLLCLRLNLLAVVVHRLVKLHILPQILQIFLELIGPSYSDIMFSLGLAVMFLYGFSISSYEFVDSGKVQVFIDEHIINFANLLLELVN